jgi:4-alpha-glucanotransferase
MNIPSTLGGNWCWRALEGAFTDEIAEKLRDITEKHNRIN